MRVQEIQAIWGIFLEVRAGEILSLVGSNGSGKTTTLKTVSRLLPCASGRIS